MLVRDTRIAYYRALSERNRLEGAATKTRRSGPVRALLRAPPGASLVTVMARPLFRRGAAGGAVVRRRPRRLRQNTGSKPAASRAARRAADHSVSQAVPSASLASRADQASARTSCLRIRSSLWACNSSLQTPISL